MLRVVLTHENSAYEAVGIKDDAVRKRPHKRGILGCDKGPDERAYAWRAMSPLGRRARRRKKGRNSTEYLFWFFSLIGTPKYVWGKVPRGTKHPPVLLEVLIGVGR